jgi:hypothetical protein
MDCLIIYFTPHPPLLETVKKFRLVAKSVFLVVQGTEKFTPPKSGGQE